MIILETVKYITLNYDVGNIADWLSGFGTVLAVIVSLYLAKHKATPFLTLKTEFFPKDDREEFDNLPNNKDSLRIVIKNYSNHPVLLTLKDKDNYFSVDKPLYVYEYTVKSNVRVIETTTFDKLDGKKFELRDAFSNNKYKFKLVKRKGEWMVIYPIRKWRMSKKWKALEEYQE